MSEMAILRQPTASFDSELLWNFLVIGLAPTPLFPHPKVMRVGHA
jgi:hypothetical protein